MPASVDRARVLLVEDDPRTLGVLETFLSEQWAVHAVGDGETALRFAREQGPDLIVADLRIPGLDGLGLLRALREGEATATIPLVIISGVTDEETRFEALRAGATDFLVKPFSRHELLLKVGSLLALSRRQESARRVVEAHYRALFEASLDGIVITDEAGRYVDVNESFCRLLGAPRERLVGAHLSDFVPEDVRATAAEAFSQLRLTGAFHGELPLSAADGTIVDLEWVCKARFLPGLHLSVVRNIAERKRIERERAALLEQAQQAQASAEAANRLKDEFLATLSHELRTPLNAICGWAQILRGTDDAGTVARAVEVISRNAQTQAQIVSDLLDVSRIVVGKFRLRMGRVDLVSVIGASLDTVRPIAEAKHVHVSSRLDSTVLEVTGDRDRLQQVLWNILSNAVKFTPQGGHVAIRLRAQPAHVEITVEDDGPGIPPDFLPHVFERFRQADSSSTRVHGGLGLGLAIARHLVEFHGGTVHAENRPQGQGAVFTVKLPRLVVEAATSADVGPAPGTIWAQTLRGQRVLVVDDDADTLELVAVLLRGAGAEVLTALSAREALEVLRRERPSVMLADIEMPHEDGYSLIKRVRGLPEGAGGGTPAAALTAYAGEPDRRRALEAGFQVHLAKPIEPAALLSAVARLAGRIPQGSPRA